MIRLLMKKTFKTMISGEKLQIINTKFLFLEDQKQVKVTLCLIVSMDGEVLTIFICM